MGHKVMGGVVKERIYTALCKRYQCQRGIDRPPEHLVYIRY